jgi:hypothetical protein
MTFDTKSASFLLMAFGEERRKLTSRPGCNRRRHLKRQHRLVEQWPLLALAAKVRFDGSHRSDETFQSKVALGRSQASQSKSSISRQGTRFTWFWVRPGLGGPSILTAINLFVFLRVLNSSTLATTISARMGPFSSNSFK